MKQTRYITTTIQAGNQENNKAEWEEWVNLDLDRAALHSKDKSHVMLNIQ